MKVNIKLIFIFLFFTYIFSEQYKEFYKTGEIKINGSYIDSLRHGKWNWYNKKGKIWQQIIYNNGKLISQTKWTINKPRDIEDTIIVTKSLIKDINEKIEINQSKIPNAYTGTWVEHYNNGSLKSVTQYLHGFKHGKEENYLSNGNIKNIIKYISGKKNGKCIYYDSLNNISEEGVYLNNKKNGRWTTFYENGKINETGIYTNDRKTGTWNNYNKNGQVIKIDEY